MWEISGEMRNQDAAAAGRCHRHRGPLHIDCSTPAFFGLHGRRSSFVSVIKIVREVQGVERVSDTLNSIEFPRYSRSFFAALNVDMDVY